MAWYCNAVTALQADQNSSGTKKSGLFENAADYRKCKTGGSVTMQPARHTAPLLNVHTLTEIEQLVDNNLKHDWVLRVEHSGDVNPVTTQWQQWGKAQFAVDDAKSLIDTILACRAGHSTHTIRLRCEKLRPQTQFTYWIYRPQESTTSDSLILEEAGPAINDSHETQAFTSRQVGVAGKPIWRIIIVTCVLLASLLILEESIA